MTVVNKEFKIIVGERLRELRKSKKWTINYLLDKLSSECYITIDEKTVRRYEDGEILPKIDNLIALSELFDTTLDYIIYGKETSDDNSYTWYDNFKRLNRLIYSLSVGIGKCSEDGKFYLELWSDEMKLYYNKLLSFGCDRIYSYENKNESAFFSVKDLDDLFKDFEKYKEQLVPVTKSRYDRWLKSNNVDPDGFLESKLKEIKDKREI